MLKEIPYIVFLFIQQQLQKAYLHYGEIYKYQDKDKMLEKF